MVLILAMLCGFTAIPVNASEAPNVLVQRLADKVIDLVKTDPALVNGDPVRLGMVVDEHIMPHVNFKRMTAAAVGRAWRTASPAQQAELQAQFKLLLIRTYASAVNQMKERRMEVKPLRVLPDDSRVIVRSEVVGVGQPIQLDYRMEKTDAGWFIYDINVLGLWLVETYRTQFAVVAGSDNDVKALLDALKALNRANAAKS
ncbi:MAG: MlaC/ttg2D family ABC transporter substrate-binding protein [Burkholderiaceae bacterium]